MYKITSDVNRIRHLQFYDRYIGKSIIVGKTISVRRTSDWLTSQMRIFNSRLKQDFAKIGFTYWLLFIEPLVAKNCLSTIIPRRIKPLCNIKQTHIFNELEK